MYWKPRNWVMCLCLLPGCFGQPDSAESPSLAPAQTPASSAPPTTAEVAGDWTVHPEVVWNLFEYPGEDGKPLPRPLNIHLTVTGPQLPQVIAYGRATVSTGTTASGELQRNTSQISLDVRDQLASIDEVPLYSGQELTLEFSFEQPTPVPSVITAFKGELTLVTAASRKLIPLPAGFPDDPAALISPELAANGLRLELDRFPTGEFVLNVIGGQVDSIGQLAVVNAAGEALLDEYSINKTVLPRTVQFLFSPREPLPAETRLILELYEQVQEHTVPFAFQNLPVPARP